jgi:hypothetical protein
MACPGVTGSGTGRPTKKLNSATTPVALHAEGRKEPSATAVGASFGFGIGATTLVGCNLLFQMMWFF